RFRSPRANASRRPTNFDRAEFGTSRSWRHALGLDAFLKSCHGARPRYPAAMRFVASSDFGRVRTRTVSVCTRASATEDMASISSITDGLDWQSQILHCQLRQ